MQKAHSPSLIVPELPCRAARPMRFMSKLRKADNINPLTNEIVGRVECGSASGVDGTT
jgi:hypothetical protein